MNHFKSKIICYLSFYLFIQHNTVVVLYIVYLYFYKAYTACFWPWCKYCSWTRFFFPYASLLLLTCRISTFLTLWKLCSPLSPSASLWVFVKWAVCAISAVLLDSLKLLWPAVCMSLFNDCPSVHCSAQLLSSTQLGHLSDQVADMFSFLFSSFLPFFSLIVLASHCKGTFFPSTQEHLVSSTSFRHSPSLFCPTHAYSAQTTINYSNGGQIWTIEQGFSTGFVSGHQILTQWGAKFVYKKVMPLK